MKTLYTKPLKNNNTSSIFSNLFNKNTSFKDTVLNNTVFKKYPYMSANSATTYTMTSIYPKTIYSDLLTKTIVTNPVFVVLNTYDDYSDGLIDLQKKLYYLGNPTYDFKLSDGTPVKIDSNYIQIGNTLVPMNLSKTKFDVMSDVTKEQLNDIFIIIDDMNNITAYAA